MSETLTSVREPAGSEAAAAPAGAGAVAGTSAAAEHEVLIQPRRGWIAVNWAELWQQRELLYFLIWRDVKVRYKQTVLGVAWALLQPLFTAAVFTVLFRTIAQLEFPGGSPGHVIPFPLAVYVGIWVWTFFATAVGNGANSLSGQAYLLSKIYMPRLFMPGAVVGTALVDMAISTVVLAGMMAWYGLTPGWGVLMLPALMGMLFLLSLGVACWAAAVTVVYRDMRNLVTFALQVGIYAIAVMYPPSIMAEKLPRWAWVLELNPVAQIITGFRAALLGTPWNWSGLAIAAGMTGGLLLFGLYYFRRAERRFADVV